MSNSVDDAVFDYFSILLNEKDDKAQAAEKASDATGEQVLTDSNGVVSAPHIEPKVDVEAAPKPRAGLAEVGRDADTKPAVKTQAVGDSKPNLKKAFKEPVDTKALEQLLASVSIDAESAKQTQVAAAKVIDAKASLQKTAAKTVVQNKLEKRVVDSNKTQQNDEEQSAALETQSGKVPPAITESLVEKLDDEFQVLFFKVAGLTLAVPLVSLGGIVKLQRVNHIMGRPSWYHGVQAHRDGQLNVVDTCAWVMPEKYDDNLKNSVEYQYVVVLEDSNWGLTCESLVNSVRILKSEVNWRSKPGKRPWLAGVVKEQMCGILHVQALIELLNLGLGSQDAID
ncbi:chemotaxis protein CheW [Shewanella waksmanii]|uniref:chemotaxis protein CheW n=1 Tax=Shewanella waksmanii TaxID=213783 RepID=UPI0037357AC5